VRADLARQIARLWENKLGEAREAADAWRRVLRLKAQDPEATTGLDRAKRNKLDFTPGQHPAQRVAAAPSAPPPATVEDYAPSTTIKTANKGSVKTVAAAPVSDAPPPQPAPRAPSEPPLDGELTTMGAPAVALDSYGAVEKPVDPRRVSERPPPPAGWSPSPSPRITLSEAEATPRQEVSFPRHAESDVPDMGMTTENPVFNAAATGAFGDPSSASSSAATALASQPWADDDDNMQTIVGDSKAQHHDDTPPHLQTVTKTEEISVVNMEERSEPGHTGEVVIPGKAHAKASADDSQEAEMVDDAEVIEDGDMVNDDDVEEVDENDVVETGQHQAPKGK
jgi:hypothetical protein